MLSVLSNNWGGGVARNSESSFYSTFCFPVTVFSKQEPGIIPPGSQDQDGLSAIVQIHRLLQVLLFAFVFFPTRARKHVESALLDVSISTSCKMFSREGGGVEINAAISKKTQNTEHTR